jgi:hypothetical protein
MRLMMEANGNEKQYENKQGCTPIHFAAIGGMKATLEFLVQFNPNSQVSFSLNSVCLFLKTKL